MRPSRLIALVAGLMVGCGPKEGGPSPAPETVRHDADSAMAAYLSAQAARDGALMSTFYLDSPDFEALMNGNRQDFNQTRSGNVEYYGSLQSITGGFTDLRSVVLGPEVVVISGVRDQTMTDTAGVAVRHTGAASWVWVKRDKDWRILQISSHFNQTPGQ